MSNDPLLPFWREAGEIGLSEAESAQVLANITARTIKGVRVGADACLPSHMDPRTFLRNDAKTIRLTPSEDAEVYRQLRLRMQRRPLVNTGESTASPAEGAAWFTGFSFLHLRLTPVLCAVLVLVVGTGTLSAAARSALPGDVLYGVKLLLNEKVRATFDFSADARTARELERLEHRLEEAAGLAASGRMKGNAKEAIQRDINLQLERLQAIAAQLAADGNHLAAIDLHARIESDLVANAAIWALLSENNAEVQLESADLLVKVRAAERVAVESRKVSEEEVKKASDAEPDTDATASKAKTSVDEALNVIVQAGAFLERNGGMVDSNLLVQANGRFEMSKKILANARHQLDAGNHNDARVYATEARTTAMQARAMVQMALNLKLRRGAAIEKVQEVPAAE